MLQIIRSTVYHYTTRSLARFILQRKNSILEAYHLGLSFFSIVQDQRLLGVRKKNNNKQTKKQKLLHHLCYLNMDDLNNQYQVDITPSGLFHSFCLSLKDKFIVFISFLFLFFFFFFFWTNLHYYKSKKFMHFTLIFVSCL